MRRAEPDVGFILLDWGSEDPAVSKQARFRLEALGPAPIIPYLRSPRELDQMRLRPPRNERLMMSTAIASCLGFNLALAWFCFIASLGTGSAAPWWALGIALALEAAGLFHLWRNRGAYAERAEGQNRLQVRTCEQAGKAFAELEDVRWIDALFANLLAADSEGNMWVRSPDHPLYPVIERLLPQLSPVQTADLLERHRKVISRFLDIELARRYKGFILVLLDALNRHGDSTYLRRVHDLAMSPSSSPAGSQIREAARACGAAIQERAAREKTAAMLLRSSQGQGVHASGLLRPAQGDISASEPLLRAFQDADLPNIPDSPA